MKCKTNKNLSRLSYRREKARQLCISIGWL